ncbi:hypothetical protein PG994_013259 [Apiospora phragmitis]|uniref:Uncharacterized protein n=1 Tax=Apiospora phragmitis TaxID=2905665 RepID=A0ABR1T851_9PEZI
MTAKTYPKRWFGNEVPRDAKRQREDVDTAPGEQLSLRGGVGSTQENVRQGQEKQDHDGQGGVDDNDRTYVPLEDNGGFILALYDAADLGIPKGLSPPEEDRKLMSEGRKAWQLLQDFLPKDSLRKYVRPALLEQDGEDAVRKESVRNMSAILRKDASVCIKEGTPRLLGEEDFDEKYYDYAVRADCAELMYYITKIIAWMVSDRGDYERYGFEKVVRKAELYRSVWRLNTAACLYTRSSRHSRSERVCTARLNSRSSGKRSSHSMRTSKISSP